MSELSRVYRNTLRFILGIEILLYFQDRLKQDLFIRFIAGIRLGEERDSVLVGDHTEYELFEVIPVIFAVAIRDLNCLKVFFILFIVPIYAETGGIRMQEMGTERDFFHDFHDDLVEHIGGSIFIDPIQGPEKNIIVEMFGSDTHPEQLFGGEVAEKPGENIQSAFVESETVQEHRFDNG